MKELCGSQAQLTGRCKPKDLVPAGGRCASARSFSFPLICSSSSSHPPRHLQSSAATGNRTCCGEMAQTTGMSFDRESQSLLEVGIAEHTHGPSIPGPNSCTSLERSGSTGASGDRQDRDMGTLLPLVTSHTSTPSPCSSIPMEQPWLHPWQDDPQPGWHRSQSALHLFKDFHLRISCQPKVTDNRVMTRICWSTLRLCFSTLGC